MACGQPVKRLLGAEKDLQLYINPFTRSDKFLQKHRCRPATDVSDHNPPFRFFPTPPHPPVPVPPRPSTRATSVSPPHTRVRPSPPPRAPPGRQTGAFDLGKKRSFVTTISGGCGMRLYFRRSEVRCVFYSCSKRPRKGGRRAKNVTNGRFLPDRTPTPCEPCPFCEAATGAVA